MTVPHDHSPLRDCHHLISPDGSFPSLPEIFCGWKEEEFICPRCLHNTSELVSVCHLFVLFVPRELFTGWLTVSLRSIQRVRLLFSGIHGKCSIHFIKTKNKKQNMITINFAYKLYILSASTITGGLEVFQEKKSFIN